MKRKVIHSGCRGVLPNGIHSPGCQECWPLKAHSSVPSKNCPCSKFCPPPHPRDSSHSASKHSYKGLPQPQFTASLKSHSLPGLPTSHLLPVSVLLPTPFCWWWCPWEASPKTHCLQISMSQLAFNKDIIY